MKKLITIITIIICLPFTNYAQDSSWKKDISSFLANLSEKVYQEYSYEIYSKLPAGDTSVLKGRFYINRRDSLVLNQNDQQLILVTPRFYLYRDTTDKRIVIATFNDDNEKKRGTYFSQFFRADEQTKAFKEIIDGNSKLENQLSENGLTTFNLTLTDSATYTSGLEMTLQQDTKLPVKITYDVRRYTNIRDRSEANNIKQISTCYGYLFNRNSALEQQIESRFTELNKEKASNDYKIIRL